MTLRPSRPLVLAGLHAAFTLTLAGSALAATPSRLVGTVAALVNDVRIKLVGAPRPSPAALRQRLSLGEQVQTGAESNMQALLLDRSSFTVGPNSRLTIDRFVYDPAGSSFSASMAKGAMRFMSGGGKHGGSRSITTPVASIGIRGTVVDTLVGEAAIAIARTQREVGSAVGGDPETASLIVLRGPGPRTQGNVAPGAVLVEAGGTTVELERPAQAVYVPGPGAMPIGPFTLSLPGLARLNDLIVPPIEARTTQSGDDPYLRRPGTRPYSRLRPVLPGALPQDPPRPDYITPGDVPIFEPRDGDYPDQGPPPSNNPPPPNNPGAGSPGSNNPGGIP